MRMPSLKLGDKVDLEWNDTFDPDLQPWATDDQIMTAIKEEKKVAKSRGFFFLKHKGFIYIYGDELYGCYSRITGIPIGCITKITRTRQ